MLDLENDKPHSRGGKCWIYANWNLRNWKRQDLENKTEFRHFSRWQTAVMSARMLHKYKAIATKLPQNMANICKLEYSEWR